MKPIRLEIEGINSYAEKQVINFEKLTSKGIFGIFGKTGSGKSTILDAITLALYGNISRGTKEFINSDREKGKVDYEFEIGEGGKRSTYRVTRRFKRKKDTGNAVSDGFIRLMKKNESGEYEVIEDGKVTEVNKKITEIIGLEESDFLRSVVLPQGKFSEFLTLSGKDRRNMLERIFSLQDYGTNLNKKLNMKKAEVSGEIEVLKGRMGEYSEISEEKLEETKLIVKEKIEERDKTEKHFKNESKALDEMVKIYGLVVEKEKYEKKESYFLENEGTIKSLIEKVQRSEKAEAVKPELERYRSIVSEIEKYEKEQKELEEKIEKSKKEVKEYKKEYDEVKKKYDNMGFVLSTKKDIEEIGKIESKIKKEEEEIKSLTQKNIGHQEKLKENKEIIDKVIIKIKELNEEKENKEKDERNNRVPNNYRENITVGIGYHRELYKIEKSLEKIKSEKEECKKEIEKAKKEIEATEEKLSNKVEEIGNIIELMAEQEKIEVLNDAEFEKINQKIILLEKESDKLKLNEKKLNTCLEEINKKEMELNGILKKEKEYEISRRKLENELEELKKIDNKNNIKKLALDIKSIWHKDFHSGDVCPVCGNKVDSLEIEEHISEKMEADKKILEEKNKNLHEIEIEIAKLGENINSAKENLKSMKNDCEEIKKEIGDRSYNKSKEEEQKYKAYKDEQKVLLKKKNEEIEKLKKKKENADKEATEIEKYKIKIKSRISGKNEEAEKLIKRETEIKKEEKDVNKKLNVAVYNIIDIIGKEKISFNEIDREFFIDQNKKISEKMENLENITKQISIIEGNIDKIKKEKEKLDEEKNSIEKSIEVTNAEIKSNKNNIETQKIEIKEKNDSIDFDKLNSIIEFKYDSISQLPGILDSFERIVSQNYRDLSNALEDEQKNLTMLENKNSENRAKLKVNKKNEEEQKKILTEKMTENGFSNEEELFNYCLDKETVDRYKSSIDIFEKERAENTAMYKNVVEKLKGRTATEEEKINFEKKVKEIKEKLDKLNEECTKEKYNLEKIEESLKQVEGIKEELKSKEKRRDNIKAIDDLFRGNRFVEYLSQIYLKNIVIEASERLYKITNGRYALEINDDYQFVISDNFNGGLRRSADTLSGGEVFLTSLALALALSSQIQLKGSAPLEFFFLDEGFGTLDADLLNTVMESLEKLYSNTLSVGIISHVEEIKARVPIKLEVVMDETLSSSVIKEI